LRLFLRGLLIVALALPNLTCSVNVLENFADKQTNMALYYDAQKLINDGEYDAAIEKLDLIIGSFAVDRKVKMLRASAYGGKCGIEFIPFVLSLADMGSTRLFSFLMSSFGGGTSAMVEHCMTAESLLTSIGTVSERTNDENMFLLVVAFTKIGRILSFYADSDNDNAVDAAFTAVDMCTEDTAAPRVAGAAMTNEDVIQIGTGIALALEQLTALSGLVDVGSDSLTDLTTICATLAGAPFNVPICTMTTTDDWTDGPTDEEEQAAVRSLVNEDQDVGIGTCAGDITACACAP